MMCQITSEIAILAYEVSCIRWYEFSSDVTVLDGARVMLANAVSQIFRGKIYPLDMLASTGGTSTYFCWRGMLVGAGAVCRDMGVPRHGRHLI